MLLQHFTAIKRFIFCDNQHHFTGAVHTACFEQGHFMLKCLDNKAALAFTVSVHVSHFDFFFILKGVFQTAGERETVIHG